MTYFQVSGLTKTFGGLTATNNLDFDVNESEIVGLIGPNGAGKSTVFNMISGFFPATSGKVLFQDQDITHLRADQIARLGIGRTFQAATVFVKSTVFENVFAGCYMLFQQPKWKTVFHTPGVRREEALARERVTEIVGLMDLDAFKHEVAQNLSHGHQKMLALCIALAGRPKLLLLDEPLTGMNTTEKEKMTRKIRDLRDAGTTIILVEHDMRAVMNLCDRIVVVSSGKKIAEGTPREIQENPDVIEAYLGKPRES